MHFSVFLTLCPLCLCGSFSYFNRAAISANSLIG